eukprot:1160662-Pelagomonas_calceolata.AAC.10
MADSMTFKADSEGLHEANLVHMDVGSAGRLAQHNLHIPEQFRCNSSCLDVDLFNPFPTNHNRPPTSLTRWELRIMRGMGELGSNTTPVSELCKQHEGDETILHTILLGVGGSTYTGHTRI